MFIDIWQLFTDNTQSDQIWQNFTTLTKSFQVLGKIMTVYFLFGKMLCLLWQICNIVGLIFSIANGQIFKNNITICGQYYKHFTIVNYDPMGKFVVSTTLGS